MTSEHDADLIGRIGAGRAAGVLVADDPVAVAEALVGHDGTLRVDVDDLPAALAGAQVRLAEVVLARARRAEATLLTGGAARRPGPRTDEGEEDDRVADRHAIRFSLAILVPALAGGIAVHLADDFLLAPALPAAALVLVAAVALTHRGGRDVPPAGTAPASGDPSPGADDVGAGPVVRAAEAHLRRRQADWKVLWWERQAPVPDPAAWSPPSEPGVPITLVSVDADRRLDARAHAAMTATVPAAVRVVALQARG